MTLKTSRCLLLAAEATGFIAVILFAIKVVGFVILVSCFQVKRSRTLKFPKEFEFPPDSISFIVNFVLSFRLSFRLSSRASSLDFPPVLDPIGFLGVPIGADSTPIAIEQAAEPLTVVKPQFIAFSAVPEAKRI